MIKLGVITAEPENFVPVEIQKAAKELGIDCAILDIAKMVHVESKAPQILYDGAPLQLDVVVPRLNEHSLDIKLALLNRLENQGVKLVNSAQSMALCNDKIESQIKLNGMGLVTPWSAVVHSGEQIDTALQCAEQAEIKFPMILKTLRGTHGIGVMKVDSKSSLTSVCQAMLAEGQQLMIQEFIEHSSSYRIIMIGQELLAANERGQPKSKDEFRTNSHLGSETSKYEPSEAELALSKQIVNQFGCNFCAIDYIKVGDTFVVLEVNGSPGLEKIQEDWADRNLAMLVAKYALSLVEVGERSEAEVEGPPEPEQPAEAPPEVAQVSDIELVTVSRLMNEPVEARIDTGAKLCSLHVENIKQVDDWVHFVRNGITYKVPLERVAKIRDVDHHDVTYRPVVLLDISMCNKLLHKVEFSLLDRSAMKYEVLIGRNALGMLGIPIVVPATAEPGVGEAEVIAADESPPVAQADEE